jgi:hypothetical protein
VIAKSFQELPADFAEEIATATSTGTGNSMEHDDQSLQDTLAPRDSDGRDSFLA